MKIAIIDAMNQDIGISILFPDADYFVDTIEFESKRYNMNKFSIIPRTDIQNINDKNYDILFIIIALYNAKPGTTHFNPKIKTILDKELEIINNNNFKKVCIFDNYDYDYDPNEIINNKKIDFFFKRNYNKHKLYKNNVIPFPFFMFGEVSIIEKILQSNLNIGKQRINRIFFSGSLFTHQDNTLSYTRDRKTIYKQIKKYIYNPGRLNYNQFLKHINDSKYSIDLNGVGDPNKRTFEILSQGSLMISEYNDLKWPFEDGDEFSKELVFKNNQEFIDIINKIKNDKDFYDTSINNQIYIWNKYFNIQWIQLYILNHLQITLS